VEIYPSKQKCMKKKKKKKKKLIMFIEVSAASGTRPERDEGEKREREWQKKNVECGSG